MTLKEAFSSGKKFKRRHHNSYRNVPDCTMILVSDAIAEDWEVQVTSKLLTADDVYNAAELAEVENDDYFLSTDCIKSLIKHLGLE